MLWTLPERWFVILMSKVKESPWGPEGQTVYLGLLLQPGVQNHNGSEHSRHQMLLIICMYYMAHKIHITGFHLTHQVLPAFITAYRVQYCCKKYTILQKANFKAEIAVLAACRYRLVIWSSALFPNGSQEVLHELQLKK